MKNAASMIIQKSNYNHAKQIRTLVLSTNVNDYDTGEPIVDGSKVFVVFSKQLSDNNADNSEKSLMRSTH